MPTDNGLYYCDDGGCGRCPYCVKFYAEKQAALKEWAEANGIGLCVLPVIAKCIAQNADFITSKPLRSWSLGWIGGAHKPFRAARSGVSTAFPESCERPSDPVPARISARCSGVSKRTRNTCIVA
jgi:hypothetical protein